MTTKIILIYTKAIQTKDDPYAQLTKSCNIMYASLYFSNLINV